MSRLLPGVAIGLSLVAFPLTAMILPAIAQDNSATVTISGAFADALAAETGIAVDALPTSLVVPLDVAIAVCGVTVEAGGTCEGTTVPAELASYLDDSSESSESSMSSSEPSSEEDTNSAKAFAPGQVKADGESAKAYAPGQTKADGESASSQAPGQKKKQ
jgi:hypothetical protein